MAPVPSPKFQKYVQVSVREVPEFLSELVSVNVAVRPLVTEVNEARGA